MVHLQVGQSHNPTSGSVLMVSFFRTLPRTNAQSYVCHGDVCPWSLEIGVEKHDFLKNLEGAEVRFGVLRSHHEETSRSSSASLGVLQVTRLLGPAQQHVLCLSHDACMWLLSGFPEACCESSGQIPMWNMGCRPNYLEH